MDGPFEGVLLLDRIDKFGGVVVILGINSIARGIKNNNCTHSVQGNG